MNNNPDRSESKNKRSRLRPTKSAREAAKRLPGAAVEETAAAEATAGSEDAAVEEGCTHVGDAPSVPHPDVACKSDEVPCPCTVL